MSDHEGGDSPTRHEMRLMAQLHDERHSTTHIRIAAVEAQARADREAQADINKALMEKVSAMDVAQRDGFRELRTTLTGIGVLLLLVIAVNLPGLMTILKGRIP